MVPAPFILSVRAQGKDGGDLEPKEETEEENTEGVDLMRATVREQWRVSPNVTS